MKQHVRDGWVSALRSGEYRQGINFLHDIQDGTWCCLGVLCDQLDIPYVDEHDSRTGVRAYRFGPNEVAQVPTSNLYEYGLPLNGPTIRKLTALNDSKIPFDRIADWIEANIPIEKSA